MAGESGPVPVAALDDLAAGTPARTDAVATFAELTADRGPERKPVAFDALAAGAAAPAPVPASASAPVPASAPAPAPVAGLDLEGAAAGVAPVRVASLATGPARRAPGSAAPGPAARSGRGRRAGDGPAETGSGVSGVDGGSATGGTADPDPQPDADGRGADPRASAGRAAGRQRGGRSGTAELDRDADPRAAAREICLRLLTDRARTRQELAQALRRRGVPEDAAAAVLGRFDEVGLIDDAAFAEQWVRSRHAMRGLGRRALAVELRRKGVADELAEEALGTIDRASEERRARELVDRELRSARAGTPEQRAALGRRLVGMLARRGYSAGLAYTVVREALAEHGAEPDELAADVPED